MSKKKRAIILLAALVTILPTLSVRGSDDLTCVLDPGSGHRSGDQRSPRIIRVPTDRPTIQAGIDAAADYDTVLVADGVYSGPGNRDINFHGKAITVKSENGPASCTVALGGTHRGFGFYSGEGGSSKLTGFTIRGGYSTISGAAVTIMNSSPWIVGNHIEDNSCDGDGAAVYCYNSDALITDNVFTGNEAGLWGGAVGCQQDSRPTLDRNIFRDNTAKYGGAVGARSRSQVLVLHADFRENTGYRGGAVDAAEDQSEVRLFHSRFIGNEATYGGGAVSAFDGGALELVDCLLTHNAAENPAGGVAVGMGEVYLSFCTLAWNEAREGGGIYFAGGTLIVENCIIWGNAATLSGPNLKVVSGDPVISWSCVEGGWSGPGNIDADPLFAGGLRGDHYLGCEVAGQSADSPCIDAGDPSQQPPASSTAVDHHRDTGIPDMGFHEPLARVAAGPGPGPFNSPRVRVMAPIESGWYCHQFEAYGTPRYGVNVACGDVSTADGYEIDEILTGAGPGAMFGPHVRGFRVDGTPLPGLSFLAYGTPRYGVNVTAGNLLSLAGPGATDEIITGAGPGAVFGPHVRAFSYNETSASVSPVPGISFFAYGTNKYGVNVAAGDIDGDGYDEIVTGAGPGAVFGPHVRGWNADGGYGEPIAAVSFMAYGTNKFGVNVTCGDVDRDGIDEIITAPGPGAVFGAHIRGWNHDGYGLTPMADLSFFAWQPEEVRYGATVSAGDIDGDWQDDIVVGCGPDPDAGTPFKVFLYRGDGSGVELMLSVHTCYPTGWSHGTRVAAGRL